MNLRREIILFIVLNFIIRIVFWALPAELTDGNYIPDDTYLSLAIAENIASGKGPLYTDSYTNGFQPLYVFLTAPVYFFTTDKVTALKIAQLMLIFFDCASLLIILLLLKKNTTSIYIIRIAAVIWLLSNYPLMMGLNGLETMISAFFILFIIYYTHKIRFFDPEPGSGGRYIFLGLLFGLAIFTRIDNTLLAFAFFLLTVWKLLKGRLKLSAEIRKYLITTISAIIIYLPWMIYSYHYTESIFPVSGKAVRMLSISVLENFGHEITGWLFFLYRSMIVAAKYSFVIWLLILGCIIYYRRNKDTISLPPVIKAALIYCVLMFCAYTFYIPAYWFFPRYFFPFFPILLISGLFLLGRIFNNSSLRFQKYAFTLVLIAVPAYTFIYGETHNLISGKNIKGYLPVGKFVDNYFEPGTIIGAPQSGGINYFADSLLVYNLDGVVNPDVFRALKDSTVFEYIERKKIEYILDWDFNIDYIAKRGGDSSLIELREVDVGNIPKTYKFDWRIYRVIYK
ncbi:MAG: hypothetical protein ACLFR2_02140 [Candidatus Kapaibacterium sp.]